MKNLFNILLPLSCICLIFSCKDDIEPENPLFLLQEIRKDGALVVGYEYNNDSSLHKIINHEYYNMELVVSEEIFSYVGDTIKTQAYKDGALEYEKKYYNLNDNFVTVERLDELTRLTDVWQYRFAGNSCGYNELKFFGDQETFTETYSYTNDCDVIITREVLDSDTTTCTIKRDDFNKAERSALIPLLRQPIKGNIIELIKVDNNQDTLIYESYNSVFEYDEDGYPSVEKRSYLSGIEEEFVFFFVP